MGKVECEYCGDLFDSRGLGAHQVHCDEATEESGTEEETILEPEDEIEAHVVARDQGTCTRCGVDDASVHHIVDPDVGREKANVVTLCGDCDDDVSGVHPRTKRTKIRGD